MCCASVVEHVVRGCKGPMPNALLAANLTVECCSRHTHGWSSCEAPRSAESFSVTCGRAHSGMMMACRVHKSARGAREHTTDGVSVLPVDLLPRGSPDPHPRSSACGDLPFCWATTLWIHQNYVVSGSWHIDHDSTRCIRSCIFRTSHILPLAYNTTVFRQLSSSADGSTTLSAVSASVQMGGSRAAANSRVARWRPSHEAVTVPSPSLPSRSQADHIESCREWCQRGALGMAILSLRRQRPFLHSPTQRSTHHTETLGTPSLPGDYGAFVRSYFTSAVER